MGVTLIFSELHVLLSHLWEKENEEKNGKEGKRNRKDWKERRKKGKGIKNWRKDKKKEF